MNKFTPYQKLSRKQQRAANAKRRGDWGITHPVTKRIESARLYNRKKLRKPDAGLGAFCCAESCGLSALN